MVGRSTGGGFNKVSEGHNTMTQSRLIINACAEAFSVNVDTMLGTARDQRHSWPRTAAMQLMRDHTDLSYGQIGNALGRNFSTVKSGEARSSELYNTSETYRSMFNRAERLVSDSIGKTGIENLHASMARAYNQNLRTIEEALAVVEAMKNANREIKAALPEVGQ